MALSLPGWRDIRTRELSSSTSWRPFYAKIQVIGLYLLPDAVVFLPAPTGCFASPTIAEEKANREDDKEKKA
jgi:hypothetical protein